MLSGLGRRGRKASTRSRLESIIASLALPEDWTIVQFVQSVEQLRGRKIHLLELPDSAPVGLCGLWLARPNDDVVFHRASSDPEQTRHTVSHEIGHMLCDHGDDAQLPPEELATYLTGVDLTAHELDLSMVKAARGISSYSDQAEYEAELLATLIATKATSAQARDRDRILRAF